MIYILICIIVNLLALDLCVFYVFWKSFSMLNEGADVDDLLAEYSE